MTRRNLMHDIFHTPSWGEGGRLEQSQKKKMGGCPFVSPGLNQRCNASVGMKKNNAWSALVTVIRFP